MTNVLNYLPQTATDDQKIKEVCATAQTEIRYQVCLEFVDQCVELSSPDSHRRPEEDQGGGASSVQPQGGGDGRTELCRLLSHNFH